MSKLAIKYFLQKQLSDLQVPVPVKVFRHQPKEADFGYEAVIYICFRRSKETRRSAPKGFGSKKIAYVFHLYFYMKNQDDQIGGEWFDILEHRVDVTLRKLPTPVDIIDPETGETSNLNFLGESIDTEDNEPVMGNPGNNLESDVIFTGYKVLLFEENVQG